MNTQTAQWIRHRERGSLYMLKIMTFLSLHLGRRISRSILYGIALYFFLFAPQARRSSLSYLRRVLNRPPTAADRFRQVLYFASSIHDRVFLINNRFDGFEISIDGEAVVRRYLDTQQGAFLMGAHLGSFEIMRSLGRRQAGLQVVMAMYEDNARRINSILAAINPDVKPDIVALGRIEAMIRIGERLDEGAFVGVLGDRTLGDEAVRMVQFLGSPAPIPVGPMRAAAILRRPVIFMAGLYRGSNRYHLVFEQVADFSAATRQSRDELVREAVDRYAQLLEKYCRSDPYNWFNFFDFWNDARDTPART